MNSAWDDSMLLRSFEDAVAKHRTRERGEEPPQASAQPALPDRSSTPPQGLNKRGKKRENSGSGSGPRARQRVPSRHQGFPPRPDASRQQMMKLEEAFLRQEKQIRELKTLVTSAAPSSRAPAFPQLPPPYPSFSHSLPPNPWGYPQPSYYPPGHPPTSFTQFPSSVGPGIPTISRPPGFDKEDIKIEEALAAAGLPAFPGCDEALRNLLTSWYFAGYYAGKFGATVEDLGQEENSGHFDAQEGEEGGGYR